MSKKIEKLFKSYREQLLHLAKLYGVVEVKSYARSSKRLTISQLELLLIKNRIKLPINRSSDKAIAKQELKESSITNLYLACFVIFFIGCLITIRPYIKNVVNEVKFTYVAEEYKSPKVTKLKKDKQEKAEINKEQEKILALKQAASRRGMILEEKAIKYILDHTFRSLSNLLNLIAELDAYSLEKKRKLTISLIRELLTSKYSSQDK